MSGEEIKKKLLDAGYQLKAIATSLGHTPQWLDSKLSAKKVSYDFIKLLAQAINKNIDFFISLENTSSSEINKSAIQHPSNTYELLIEQLYKRIADKEELITSLKEQIELLKSQQKNDVPQEGNAMNADAAGFSDK